MRLETSLQEAGLSDGEARVYLALIDLGASTTGPIIDKSGVARSFIYNILTNLIEKGLVSSIKKNKQRLFQAAEPKKILEYVDRRVQELSARRSELESVIPSLEARQKASPKVEVQVYEGFKGVQTAFEHFKLKLEKGGEYVTFGHPKQETHYTIYWQRHHVERAKMGIKARMLFDQDAPNETMDNRNSYPLCDTRFIPSSIECDSWFMVYGDTLSIFLQEDRALAVEIVNQKIADTFKGIFEDYWAKSKRYG